MEKNLRKDGLPLIVVTDKEAFDKTEQSIEIVEDDSLNLLTVHHHQDLVPQSSITSLLSLMANRSRRPSIVSKTRYKKVTVII